MHLCVEACVTLKVVKVQNFYNARNEWFDLYFLHLYLYRVNHDAQNQIEYFVKTFCMLQLEYLRWKSNLNKAPVIINLYLFV